ncbi:Type I pilus biogensis protein FimA, partial [Pseudomonas syringae pv. tagetis]
VAVLKDDLGTTIDHGTPSKEYNLHETNPTDMLFYVMYRSTAASVTAGATEADVRFSVAIN